MITIVRLQQAGGGWTVDDAERGSVRVTKATAGVPEEPLFVS